MKGSGLRLTKFKRKLLKCLLDRACRINRLYKAMHLDFNNITNMLLRNGYHLHVIQNQITRMLDNKYYESNFKQKK